jgi:DNA-binding NarL/FixJ family response regulator
LFGVCRFPNFGFEIFHSFKMLIQNLHTADQVLKQKSTGNRRKGVKPVLTRREIQILQSLKKGYFYKEVGNELNISVDTVKKHVKNIYTKLDVRNKTEALNKLFD